MPRQAPGYRLMKGEDFYPSTAAGLTATASGVQGNSFPISADISQFTTVTTAADSAVLPVATAGAKYYVINGSANSMGVFPALGDKVNALSVNAVYALAAGKNVEFICPIALQWYTNPA